MKKKTKITRYEKRVLDRHKKQEAEYGRDEFLFGADEDDDEEADIEFADEREEITDDKEQIPDDNDQIAEEQIPEEQIPDEQIPIDQISGKRPSGVIGETTAIIADGIIAEQLSALAGEMAMESDGSRDAEADEDFFDEEESAEDAFFDEEESAGTAAFEEEEPAEAAADIKKNLEDTVDFDFYDMPAEAEAAAMAAVAAMADSEEASAIAEEELRRRKVSRESSAPVKNKKGHSDPKSEKTKVSRDKTRPGDNDDRRGGLSVTDKILILTGVCVVVIAVISGVIFANARGLQKQIAEFAEVGSDTEDIYIIGEQGLNAIASARAEYVAMAEEVPEEPEEEEEPEEIILEEKDIQIVMKVTSVQSDLKIKFSNKSTGKLIPGVPFAVTVKSDSGKTYNWKDENKDGIMHHTEVPNGTYSVAMDELPEGEYDNYSAPADVTGIKVTDKIEYKKIDVADEVKTEAEVNVAAEDTAKQDTVVESQLVDTVEWVESTKTLLEGSEDGYKEISKDNIVLSVSKAVTRVMQYFGASAPETAIISLGDQVEETNPDASSEQENSDGSQNTDSGTGEENTENLIPTADSVTEVRLDNGSLSLKEGETGSLTVTVERMNGEKGGNVTWSSSDDSIATISEDGTVTAISSGTVTITVTSADDSSKTSTCTVTVSKKEEEKEEEENKEEEKKDDESEKKKETENSEPLKDKDGNQVYIKDADGNYLVATGNDYDKYTVFYIKSDAKAVYIYTGWQTIDGYTYYFDKYGNYVTGDQIIQGAQYTFDSDGHLSSGSGTMGIDVSKWNGSIDWTAVKNSGVSYVIIRCGYRGSTTGALIEDPKFKANISGARAAGLSVGAYFFTQAVNEVEAVEEASMAASLCSGYGLTLPLFLDVESSGGRGDRIDASTRTAVVKAFCQTVRNSGFTPGVYANKTWFTEKMQVSQISSFKIWLAQYAAEPTYNASRIDYWQYSSKGKIAGIKGNVDLNIKY